MNLSAIFAKPIDRPIEGVIKADDEAGLRLEVEEYVLTNEIAKRLEAFLRAYLDYQIANGVWISGFFGSGKSHLLKMLALLLENREVEGTPALGLFLPKCGDNELLRGVNAAVIALVLVVGLSLLRSAVTDVWTALLFAAGMVALLRYRLDTLWLFGGGALLGLVHYLFAGAL